MAAKEKGTARDGDQRMEWNEIATTERERERERERESERKKARKTKSVLGRVLCAPAWPADRNDRPAA